MKDKLLKTPDQVLTGLWARVPGYIRLTFGSAMVLGLATHLYALTNKLPNHDDIGHLFQADYGTPSGRWFLPTVLQWDGDFSMPWLIGLLALLCLSVGACFAVELLRIRRPVGCVVAAGLMVTFPTVAATFAYMFASDAYFFGILLAAFGAWAAVRLPRAGLPLGMTAIVLSMGIYQSYFSVAAALMVGALLFETLDGEKTFRELMLKGVKLVVTLGAAMAVYMIVVKITTRDVGLVDYMGISTMGQLSLSQLPKLILKCYWKYFTFFFREDFGFHFWFIKYLVLLAGAATGVVFVLLLRKRQLDALRTALAAVLLLLYPLAGDLIHIMTAGGGVHVLMIYGMVTLLLIPLGLADVYCDQAEEAPGKQLLRAGLCWAIVISMALTAYSYMVADNKAYFKMDISYRQAYAYSNRLLSAIESTQGYTQGMPVVLVGSHVEEWTLAPTPQLDEIWMVGVFDLADYRTNYTYGYFLNYYLGFTGVVYLGDSPQALALAEKEAVQAMATYPQYGSTQVLDGMLVVKLN